MNDEHAALWATESAACEPTEWERWVDELETQMGHSADGDQESDGYSLDGFYSQWKARLTPTAAAAAVTRCRDGQDPGGK